MANENVTNIVDLANVPTEITICGKKYKAQRLSIKEIIGTFEGQVREEYDKETIQIAQSLSTEDKKWYLPDRSKNKPVGNELYKAAMEKTESFDGLFLLISIGLNKLQVVSDSEVSNIMMASKDEEIAFEALVGHLLGDNIASKKKDDAVVTAAPDNKKK